MPPGAAWGTFFGFLGVAFAAVTALGAGQSFTEGERRRRREAEQVRHAACLGEAFRGGPAGPAVPPSSGGAPADPTPPWYPGDPARPGEGTGDGRGR